MELATGRLLFSRGSLPSLETGSFRGGGIQRDYCFKCSAILGQRCQPSLDDLCHYIYDAASSPGMRMLVYIIHRLRTLQILCACASDVHLAIDSKPVDADRHSAKRTLTFQLLTVHPMISEVWRMAAGRSSRMPNLSGAAPLKINRSTLHLYI